MAIQFDIEAANAAFSPPNCDGSFEPEFSSYLSELGERRPMVVLAFAPKAAGTYLRSAAIVAADGKLVRTVHAQGGRDASFYLPTFLLYYAGGFPAQPLVTHVHMQALPANRHFIEAFNLKPVIMIRAIPDMLASYADMLEADPQSPDNWLNMRMPQDYAALTPEQKSDFLVDMMGPWYASYFATWMEYAASDSRVLTLHYDQFRANPLATLEALLAHSGIDCSRARCEASLRAVWDERQDFRFNRGISGRGAQRFSPDQIARLRRQIGYYPNLAAMTDTLIPPSAASSATPSAAA